MIGQAGLTKNDADAIRNAYRVELARFDSVRAMMAWDALLVKQQAALETLGCPTMFVTDVKSDREVWDLLYIL